MATKRKLDLLRDQAAKKLSPEALEARSKLYKLKDFPAGTVFEVVNEKNITTVNGEAILAEFSTEIRGKKVEGKLIIPSRVAKDVEGKTPLIMIYQGVKVSTKNKEYHDLSFIDLERSARRSTREEQEVEVVVNHLEEARSSFSDCEEEVWNPPQCSETDLCNEGLNVCYGHCPLCREHMPYSGSQCKCVLRTRV